MGQFQRQRRLAVPHHLLPVVAVKAVPVVVARTRLPVELKAVPVVAGPRLNRQHLLLSSISHPGVRLED